MTKEVKLALILGFMVTLVVSILISDHLSQARDALIESAGPDGTDGDTRLVTGNGLYPGQAPRNFSPPPIESVADSVTESVARGTSGSSLAGASLAEKPAQPDDLAITGSSRPQHRIVDPIRAAQNTADSVQFQGGLGLQADRAAFGGQSPNGSAEHETVGTLVIDQQVAGNEQNSPVVSLSDALERFRSQLPTLTSLKDRDRDRGGLAPSPVRSASQTDVSGDSTEPTPGYWYIVKNNESLSSIARNELGTGNRWREIADANPQRLLPEYGVRVGVRLWIPSEAKRSVGGSRESNGESNSEPEPVGAREAEVAEREYTVKSGDSLSKIAARELGSSARYTEIKALNGLESDVIRLGQVLKLPAASR